jgi:uncharacterized membrane protein YagU involved in acid resistance
VNSRKIALAGLAGTLGMTLLMLMAPLMGMPKMPIGDMLGQFLHIGSTAGWVMHFVIGLVLAAIYAALFAARLPGSAPVRGALYGVGVFVVAQVVVTPMMGGGVFSGGNLPVIAGSLIGHLVYGGIVGALYGRPEERGPALA